MERQCELAIDLFDDSSEHEIAFYLSDYSMGRHPQSKVSM
jgi:hypothetical protein